jgi:hypothetical protein
MGLFACVEFQYLCIGSIEKLQDSKECTASHARTGNRMRDKVGTKDDHDDQLAGTGQDNTVKVGLGLSRGNVSISMKVLEFSTFACTKLPIFLPKITCSLIMTSSIFLFFGLLTST